MFLITAIILLSLTSIQCEFEDHESMGERDESGFMTVFQVSSLLEKLCEKERKLDKSMHPGLFGAGKTFLKVAVPPLPGPGKLGPAFAKLYETSYNTIITAEDNLINQLEHKPVEKRPFDKAEAKDPHKMMELRDALNAGALACRFSRILKDVIQSKSGDLAGLGYVRLPLKDLQHKFKLTKALDILNLGSIPLRFHRLTSGQLGVFPPPAKHSIFESKSKKSKAKSTEKAKVVKKGKKHSMFGRSKKEPVEEKKHGKAKKEKPVKKEKKHGMFSSLFAKKKKKSDLKEDLMNLFPNEEAEEKELMSLLQGEAPPTDQETSGNGLKKKMFG